MPIKITDKTKYRASSPPDVQDAGPPMSKPPMPPSSGGSSKYRRFRMDQGVGIANEPQRTNPKKPAGMGGPSKYKTFRAGSLPTVNPAPHMNPLSEK